MRKLLLLCLVLLCLTGCSKTDSSSVPEETQPETAAEETAGETEAPTETTPVRDIAQRAASLRKAGDTHVFDECGALDGETVKTYNDYLGWLAETRLLCTTVVLTDDLNGSSPEAFAQTYYQTLWGTGTSGFLVLINNDTGQDCIYREGVVASYVDDAAVSLAVAQASPALVEGRYADALEILLPLGERIPERILERSGTLSPEQVQALTAKADALPKKYCVYFAASIPAPAEAETQPTATEPQPSETEMRSTETQPTAGETQPPETTPAPTKADPLSAYAEQLRVQTEAEGFLLIDVPGKQGITAGSVPAELTAAVQAALAEQDAYAAADVFLEGLK